MGAWRFGYVSGDAVGYCTSHAMSGTQFQSPPTTVSAVMEGESASRVKKTLRKGAKTGA